jgi:hypothetical protein
MTRAELKKAIRDEVMRTIPAYAQDRVVWDRQKAPARPVSSVELRITGPVQVGAADGEIVTEFDPAAPPGEEIVRGTAVDHEFTLHVQTRATTHDEAWEAAHAIDVGMFFPSAIERLAALGIAIVDSTPVLDVAAMVETGWQGRAAFTIRLRIGMLEVDPVRTTFIESAPVAGST